MTLNKRIIKRQLKRFWLRLIYRWLKPRDRVQLPKRMSESERCATAIFMLVLHNQASKLYYDLQTTECYLRSEDSTLFIFLESQNVKVINSVYGYDVNISLQLENFLVDRFRRELAIRRRSFKREAIAKCEHSLENTLNKLQS